VGGAMLVGARAARCRLAARRCRRRGVDRERTSAGGAAARLSTGGATLVGGAGGRAARCRRGPRRWSAARAARCRRGPRRWSRRGRRGVGGAATLVGGGGRRGVGGGRDVGGRRGRRGSTGPRRGRRRGSTGARRWSAARRRVVDGARRWSAARAARCWWRRNDGGGRGVGRRRGDRRVNCGRTRRERSRRIGDGIRSGRGGCVRRGDRRVILRGRVVARRELPLRARVSSQPVRFDTGAGAGAFTAGHSVWVLATRALSPRGALIGAVAESAGAVGALETRGVEPGIPSAASARFASCAESSARGRSPRQLRTMSHDDRKRKQARFPPSQLPTLEVRRYPRHRWSMLVGAKMSSSSGILVAPRMSTRMRRSGGTNAAMWSTRFARGSTHTRVRGRDLRRTFQLSNERRTAPAHARFCRAAMRQFFQRAAPRSSATTSRAARAAPDQCQSM